MAVEQSRTSGSDMRSHASKASQASVRGKTTDAQDGALPVGDFAAVLAATDVVVAPELEGEAACSVDEAVPYAAMPADSKPQTNQAQDAAQDDKNVVPTANGAVAADHIQRTMQSSVGGDTSSQSSAASTAATSVAALMAGWNPLASEVVSTSPGQGAGTLELTGGGASASGGFGRGFMKTSQLQQGSAQVAGKSLGSTGRASVASDPGASTPGDASVLSTASLANSTMDVRSMVRGRLGNGDPGMVADMGARAVAATQSSGALPETGVRDWRVQEDPRGAAGTTLDSWSSESTELQDQGVQGPVLEDQPVQETVKYWIGADSKQQAELTVADVGGGSLDVTIHMQGKEAQVSFQADAQQARDALRSTSGQLEQLLGQEGLTLSGLSVGTSSAGQDGKRDTRQGEGKVIKVPGADPVGASSALGAASVGKGFGSQGRTLDLFV